MEKEFVPYELAVKLKELGLETPCFGGWDKNRKWYYHPDSDITVDAPLWQQAFDWFRENCELMNHITTHLNTWGKDGELEESYGYRIMFNKDGWKCDVWDKLSYFDTYEEARLECLKKLIEIMSK